MRCCANGRLRCKPSRVPVVRVDGLRLACRPLATRIKMAGLGARDAALRSRSCTLSTRRDHAPCLTRAQTSHTALA